MFRNYFKTAWRNLLRNKVFSFINIFGLALGMACSLLILLWVQDERKMDAFHRDSDHLYIVYERVFSEGKVETGPWTPGLLARELKRRTPGIHMATGFWKREDEEDVFALGDKRVNLRGAYADSDFFRMMSFPLLEGTAATALAGPDDIAISQRVAVNFFGSAHAAFGRSLRINNGREMRIAAVFADLPATSSLQFSYVVNYTSLLHTITWLTDWINRSPMTIIELEPHADPAHVEAQIKDFITPYLRTAYAGGYHLELGLQRFDESYLHNLFKNGRPSGGRIEYVRLFTLVAFFVLLIACINFMNLATARSVKRAREVGIRKAVGALRGRLIVQFIGEAMLLTSFAIVIALALVAAVLPAFRELTGKAIYLPFDVPGFWLALMGLMLVTGFIAGSYPALFLSGLRPVLVLKGALRFGFGALLFRKGLVVFQFVLSIVLIAGTIVISRQIHYMLTKDLGFDRGNLVYIPFQGDLTFKYEVFKQGLAGVAGIAAVTRSTQAPSHIGTHVYDLDWDGKSPDTRVVAIHNGVGYGWIDLMKVPVIRGRDFSRDFPTDSNAVLINETLAKTIGFADPVGKRLQFFGQQKKIIGVVRDFHLRSLRDPIEPLVLYLAEYTDWGCALVKTQAGKTREALAGIERVFKQLEPAFPFRYYFSDEEYQKLYNSEQTVGVLADCFSFLAVFISCLGLLGLTIFTAEQRRREIGVRKVIGAGVGDIVLLLSRDIVRLILLASVIAGPLAWLAMSGWLRNYAYRVSVEWWTFAIAGVVALGIALLTISYEAVRAATANPVKGLRVE